MTKIEQINNLQSQLETLTKTLAEINKDTHIIKDLFANSGSVPITTGCTATIELLAGRSGCFKPTELTMYALTSNGITPVPFEILDATVMGNPQFVNYQGNTVPRERGLIKFWNKPRPIDWQPFGACSGQGLQIVVRNMSSKKSGVVYIHMKGYETSYDRLGKW